MISIGTATLDSAFAPVGEALEELVARDGGGASVSVMVDGKCVVNIVAGLREDNQPWTLDTLVCVFSVTKGAATLAMQILADRGLLDVDAPVSRYWPEFAAGGKEGVLVRHVLGHTCGVPMFEQINSMIFAEDARLLDLDFMASMLAAAAPQFPIGAPFIYHHVAYGMLVGELCQRITGRSIGDFFRSEVAEKVGSDFWIGTPVSEHSRITPALPPVLPPAPADAPHHPMVVGSVAFLDKLVGELNTAQWRVGELAATNGHATARGIAEMYVPLATGGMHSGERLLSAEIVERFAREESSGVNPVTGGRISRALGYSYYPETQKYGIPLSAFGHDGAGGAMGFADPAARVSFGLTRSQMVLDTASSVRVAGALYSCL